MPLRLQDDDHKADQDEGAPLALQNGGLRVLDNHQALVGRIEKGATKVRLRFDVGLDRIRSGLGRKRGEPLLEKGQSPRLLTLADLDGEVERLIRINHLVRRKAPGLARNSHIYPGALLVRHQHQLRIGPAGFGKEGADHFDHDREAGLVCMPRRLERSGTGIAPLTKGDHKRGCGFFFRRDRSKEGDLRIKVGDQPRAFQALDGVERGMTGALGQFSTGLRQSFLKRGERDFLLRVRHFSSLRSMLGEGGAEASLPMG